MMNLFPTARFVVAAILVAVSAGFAVDGIAISTHRTSDGGLSCGFGTDIVGKIVRHDIRASVVVKDTVIYNGGARCVVINQTGDRVAFVKDQGRISVINMNGTGFKEFTNTQNSFGSWIDWPEGDWVYYFQKTIGPPDGSFGNYGGAMEAKNLRRVNVTSGVDEFVAEFGAQNWQFGMAAKANKSGGLLVTSGPVVGSSAITVNVFDMAAPGNLIRSHDGCSPGVSPSGEYYLHNSHSHKDMFIYNLAGTQVANIYMNEYAAAGASDGRDAGGGWTRNRWSANSDKWVMAPHSTSGLCADANTDMVLYNWADKEQIYVTRNHRIGSGSDEPMDFWVDQGPRFGLNPLGLEFTANGAKNIALTNGGGSGVIPTAAVAARRGTWLTVSRTGTGNAQTIVNTVNNAGLASGEYLDTVTVSDPGAVIVPVSYVVRLLVGPFVASSVALSPQSPFCLPGNTVQFSAALKDQFGNDIAGGVTWTLPAGGGSISSTGLFTSEAGKPGSFTIQAASTGTPAVFATTTVNVGDVPSTGLVFWVRADMGVTRDDGGLVSAWENQVSGGSDAVATGLERPQYVASAGNGMPAVNFNGDQKLTFPQLKMTDFTVCAVYRTEAASKPYQFWMGGVEQGLHAGGTSSGYAGWGAWGPGFIWRLADATPLDWGQVTITNNKLYRNGVETAYQQTGTLPSLALSTLGSRPDRSDQGFVGDIAEVLIYNQTLTETDRELVDRYLSSRYNTTAPAGPISLTAPNGGETKRVDDTLWIDWTATKLVNQVLIDISVDNGASWWQVPTGSSISTDDDRWGHYAWVLPDTIRDGPTRRVSLVSKTCRIRVKDYFGNGSDESNAVFTIVGRGMSAAAPALIARGAPVLQGLQLQLPGSGVYAIDIFTLRGARAGSFQLKAPGTFDLSHAGLSNGVYQIRVRVGAGIFWLKAPVVR